MSKRTKWILIAVVLTLGLCLLPGIVAIFTSGDKTTEISSAAPTLQPTASTATPTGATSAGLGHDRATWDRQHTNSGANAGFQDYDKGVFSLLFMDDKVWHLERNYKPSVLLARARTDAAELIPADATLVRTYHPEGFPELTVDLYLSPWLRDRFPAEDWTGGEPGNFIVIFNIYDGQISRSVIGLGNNPVGGAGQPVAPNTSAPPPTAATPAATVPTVKSVANLRAGPGTTYAKTGSALVGQALNVVARNQAGDWYQLATGAWIAAFLVANPPAGVPIATVSPPTPAVAAPVRAAPAIQAAPVASVCDCTSNLYNCADFGNAGAEAQACYQHCLPIAGDIHDLDRDGDGHACEYGR